MKLFTLTDNGVLAGAEIIIGSKESIGGIPLCPRLLAKIKDKVAKLVTPGSDDTVEGTRYLLSACEFVYGPQNEVEYITEERVQERRCVLLVDVYPGEGGHIEFRADLEQELHDPTFGEVHRKLLPISMATGIQIIAETDGAFPTTLMRLTPGSRFRMRRTGDVMDEEGKPCLSQQMLVKWNGWWSSKVIDNDPIAPPKSQNERQLGLHVNVN